jgi:dynein heavy chain 2
VTLLREVRQLTSLGFKIPKQIRSAAEEGQKFYRHAIVLKQVANFYNNFKNQLIPSQKTMLLESAVAFELEVKNMDKNRKERDPISWNNPSQVESYIHRVQLSMDRIHSENRKLCKLHATIAEKVVQLFNLDLLKNQDKWRESAREIRAIMDGLQNQGYREELMRDWRIHWDYQLYKALEYQYRLGLECLNENLPEIPIELVYKNNQLLFRPPFEEVRAKYYNIMKKFIKFPSTFDGVGGNGEIFKVSQHLCQFSSIFVIL